MLFEICIWDFQRNFTFYNKLIGGVCFLFNTAVTTPECDDLRCHLLSVCCFCSISVIGCCCVRQIKWIHCFLI